MMIPKIHDLLALTENRDHVYIQPHNIPDPDAIASAYGLKMLLETYGVKSSIVYLDPIEKANSKNMVEMFDVHLELINENFISTDHDLLILIDTQAGHSNVTELHSNHRAVIDHHLITGQYTYAFEDVREEVGACSSIIASYYKQLGIIPSLEVATALVYGIMNDTDNLTRNNNKEDVDMFYWLYAMADFSKIKDLRMNEIGKDDIFAYAKALENIEIYGNVGFIHIEECNDSLLGTISDMVYTIEGVSVVVSYAKRSDGIKFSIRSGIKDLKANRLVKYILADHGIGGGHDEMAGGFITKDSMDFLHNRELDTYVRYRVLSYLEKESCL